MTDEIVKRLRSLADCDARSGEPLGKCMREAADEIGRLRAALKLAQNLDDPLLLEIKQLRAEIARRDAALQRAWILG